MEIRTRPVRGRGRLALSRVLPVAAVLLAVVLLAPRALGLQSHAVEDDAMSGRYAQGSLVLGEPVPAGELAVGQVVTFTPPAGVGEATRVTRRIVEVQGDRLLTRGDAAVAVDPWLLRVDDPGLWRVSHAVPWVGYPWLVVRAAAPLLLGGLLLALVVVGARTRRRARRASEARRRRSVTGVRARATLV